MRSARHKTVNTVISKISDRRSVGAAALVVIHGDELGKKHDLTRHEMIIGRSSKADIQVDQDAVSRHHACLTKETDGRIRLKDLGSTNGTFVNDRECGEEPVEVRSGDYIKVGRTIFKFLAGGTIEAAYHEEIYRLTTTDGLTQIYNKRFFQETLAREVGRSVRYGRPLSLVLLDLDHFKAINDTAGHLAGDHVLQKLAQTIQARVRKEDLFCRYGGEEFALILPEVTGKGAMTTAEKLRKLVEKTPFEFEGERLAVTVSMGCGSLTKDMKTPEELVAQADERLYEAKRAGRNRVVGPA